MPIAVFKSVREVSSEDAVHVAENLLKENAGKKWRTKSPGEKSAYVILEFEDPQQITGIDIGNEHSAFIEVLVSRTGCQTDDFRELLLSSSFMTPIESKNSNNQNRVRCFSGSALSETVLPEKWKLLKIVCTQPFNRHVQYGLSFVKVHVVAAPANSTGPPKVKSLLPQGMMQFGAFKLREESPDSETDNQVNRFQRWKKETQQQSPASVSTAAAIRDAGSTALRRLSIGKVSTLATSNSSTPKLSPKPSSKPLPSPSPVPNSLRSESPAAADAKPLDRNRASLLFGDDDEDEAADEGNAKKQRLSKHLEADKDRRRLEQEKERESKKNKSSRHSLDKSSSKEEKSKSKDNKSSSKEHRSSSNEHRSSSKEHNSSTKEEKIKSRDEKSSKKDERSHSKEKSARKEDKSASKHDTSKRMDTTKGKDSPRPPAQKRHSSPTAVAATPAKKQKVKDAPIQYRPFNELLKGVILVISGIQNPDRADLRSKAVALGAKYKADWEPGCTHLICAFKHTPKYNQVKGKGKIVTRSWIEKCFELKKYLPWRRYALDTNDIGQPESDVEVCDEAVKPNSRRESSEGDVEMVEDIKVIKSYDIDHKKIDIKEDASSGIDTEDELERVNQENNVKNTKNKTPVKAKSQDVYDISTDEEDYLALKKK
ncbi:DNA repair protein XRCC1 [Drosophila eugracilis]|uniref:DNA repair protein XRCC1 n=1 Tax=Drosophila eugracilis TaxID=29029 RepID=UPI0007E783B1|nr:DNA repair protein XRCC1 [Drosophila eugracilis]